MMVVVCVSFGHAPEDVDAALASSVELSREMDLEVVCVDDSSGSAPPTSAMYEVLETSERVGFAGAVNFVVQSYPSAERFVLINPDASVPLSTMRELTSTNAALAAPTVRDRMGTAENVRPLATARGQFAALLLGEWSVSARAPAIAASYDCPPVAPSGSVLSVRSDLLRLVPLREELFWLEQSDWIIRLSGVGVRMTLEMVSGGAFHSGASTSVRYPLSVAASQARAKVAFIRDYGSPVLQRLIPVAVLSRALRVGVKRRQWSAVRFVYLAAVGRVDWRVQG